ncbi:Hypp2483 [Branchiostoma lanceolatum]|uniref:Hypp2483 protein n=1 Tax=Branchiostoma lanceolatum TaxID=7740 RepID=A0A8J9ZR63_BRALA|nr:Hypp2483 [Branchiostoma lanceolatum]
MQDSDSRNGGAGTRVGRQGRVFKDYKRIKLSPKVWQDWRARQEQLGFTTANELAKYLLSLSADHVRKTVGGAANSAGNAKSSDSTTTSWLGQLSTAQGMAPVLTGGPNGDLSPT